MSDKANDSTDTTGGAGRAGTGTEFTPVPLRQYSLLADGERGALLGPQGDVAFLCAPRWHHDAVFSSLLGGAGRYAVTPRDPRHVWSGSYDQDTLIWRGRWVSGQVVSECRNALAFPGERDRLVLLRRIEAVHGTAAVRIELDARAGFGTEPMAITPGDDGVWSGHTGDLLLRWSGAGEATRVPGNGLVLELDVPEGASHDLVLEIGLTLPEHAPAAADAWRSTERAWAEELPDLTASVTPGDSRHSWAVLRGLTSSSGAMVAAATTSLPEHADRGRNYDYRYAWIRDQCFAGQAAAAAGSPQLLDAAVSFVRDRVLADGADLKPAYTVDGEPVPDERDLDLPGYPGAPVRVGNHVNAQFQLDTFGEALLLFAAADRADRLDEDGWRAVEVACAAIEQRQGNAGAGIWELDDRRWAHSRLICAAGLRTIAAGRTPPRDDWLALADQLVASTDRDCLHPDGRWQRSPDDPAVDAALLLPGLRGAVPSDDPRHLATIAAVRDQLSDDGYVYRFRQNPDEPLHTEEGAFLLSGLHLALAVLQQGDHAEAIRWFERTRAALGPPGLFTEEFDVVRRQLRGNLPQAFVHALLLETAHHLAAAGLPTTGFTAEVR